MGNIRGQGRERELQTYEDKYKLRYMYILDILIISLWVKEQVSQASFASVIR
jgi:hypothetical protein